METLLAAIDAGYRFLDTAVLYGRSLSESMIGEALRQRADIRGDIIVTTKAGRSYEGFDFSYDGILRCVEGSLERLGMDRLEIVYIHDPMDYPMDEVLSARGALGALRHLQDQGVIDFIGTAANDPPTNLPYIQNRRVRLRRHRRCLEPDQPHGRARASSKRRRSTIPGWWWRRPWSAAC